MKWLNWQSCRNPDDINIAIAKQDEDWYGLKNAEQIVSITYDPNHNCYVVIWIVEDEEENNVVEEIECETPQPINWCPPFIEEENNVGIKESYGVEVQHVEK